MRADEACMSWSYSHMSLAAALQALLCVCSVEAAQLGSLAVG